MEPPPAKEFQKKERVGERQLQASNDVKPEAEAIRKSVEGDVYISSGDNKAIKKTTQYDETKGSSLKDGDSRKESSDASDIQRWEQEALFHFRKSAWEDVIRACENVLRVDSTNFNALYWTGYAHMRLGDYEAASRYLMRAHRIDSQPVSLHLAIKDLWRMITISLGRRRDPKRSRERVAGDQEQGFMGRARDRESSDHEKMYAEIGQPSSDFCSEGKATSTLNKRRASIESSKSCDRGEEEAAASASAGLKAVRANVQDFPQIMQQISQAKRLESLQPKRSREGKSDKKS